MEKKEEQPKIDWREEMRRCLEEAPLFQGEIDTLRMEMAEQRITTLESRIDSLEQCIDITDKLKEHPASQKGPKAWEGFLWDDLAVLWKDDGRTIDPEEPIEDLWEKWASEFTGD